MIISSLYTQDILKVIYHAIVITYTAFQCSSGDNKLESLSI